jgi:pimeloyl-ACP methyl ester carboxylesterase
VEKINNKGIEFSWDIQGNTGEPLVFLNGIAMTISHWTPVIKKLKNNYRILLHDFRGQLLSGKPEGEYSLEMHADDLLVIMDETGFESAHLVGTSYGSEVAMVFALKYPERCKSLTLIDGVSELDAVLEAAVDSWKLAALIDPRLFYRTLIPWNYSPEYLKEHRQKMREREEIIVQLPPEYFKAFARLCDAFSRINLTPYIHKINCPVLVVVGELDILKHLRFSEIIKKEIPNSRLEIVAGSGHAVVIEKPKETAWLIDSFLMDDTLFQK